MNIKYLINLLIILLFIVSCETNPPTTPLGEPLLGKVFVSSNIAGADIYLDDVFTQKTTPDTITATIGEHKISLSEDGYISNSTLVTFSNTKIETVNIVLVESNLQKVVLLEDFANVSCDPCVISNSIIRGLHSKYGDKIAIIKFSTNFPSPNDPFYLSSKSMNDARMGYYNILFAPTIIVDGRYKPIATDSADVIQDIEARLAVPSKFNIIAYDSITSASFYSKIKVEIFDNELDLTNLRLISAVIEKEINFNIPPGSNGEVSFNDVVRGLLPNVGGTVLINNGQENQFDFYIDLDPVWNVSQLSAVVFIQNIETGEILQASSSIN